VSIYAVNGNEPVAAWIESLDPEAVTSSKATDLIGTNHGTLTNMDLSADPDTARRPNTHAGGTRALLFDGINDTVLMGSANVIGTTFSVSFWFNLTDFSNAFPVFFTLKSSAGVGFEVFASNASGYEGISFGSTSTFPARRFTTVSTGTWHHVLLTYNGSVYTAFFNGTAQIITTTGGLVGFSNATRLSGNGAGQITIVNGLMDDVRVFDVVLDQEDATYLSSRRAVIQSTGKKRPRINGSLINSGLCRSSAS
jgi:hypothetical protein